MHVVKTPVPDPVHGDPVPLSAGVENLQNCAGRQVEGASGGRFWLS
jgi:hypothetical protein